MFKREADLEQAVIPLIAPMFLLWKQQVPLHNRMIDLAGIGQSGELIAVEFKLRAWRCVLKQARSHLNACDTVYVCMPYGGYADKLLAEAKTMNIGVILYADGAVAITPPTGTNGRWEPNHRWLRKVLNE